MAKLKKGKIIVPLSLSLTPATSSKKADKKKPSTVAVTAPGMAPGVDIIKFGNNEMKKRQKKPKKKTKNKTKQKKKTPKKKKKPKKKNQHKETERNHLKRNS